MPTEEGSRKQAANRRREEILQAAVRLFCERGYEGTTIREIANELGVAEGLLYHYFTSKSELVAECWRRHQWHGRLSSIVRSAGQRPVEDVIHNLLREHLRVIYEHGSAFRMHAAEMLRDGALAELSQRFDDDARTVIAAYISQNQARGRIRSDLDPHVITGALMGMVVTFFVVHGRKEAPEWERLSDHMAANASMLIVHGITPVAAPSESA